MNFILACILISSALLAAEDPVREHSPRNEVLLPFAIFLSGIGWDGIEWGGRKWVGVGGVGIR